MTISKMVEKGDKMREYNVSFMCVYSEDISAELPEEAADSVQSNCPYDVDGTACVTDIETGEQFEI